MDVPILRCILLECKGMNYYTWIRIFQDLHWKLSILMNTMNRIWKHITVLSHGKYIYHSSIPRCSWDITAEHKRILMHFVNEYQR